MVDYFIVPVPKGMVTGIQVVAAIKSSKKGSGEIVYDIKGLFPIEKTDEIQKKYPNKILEGRPQETMDAYQLLLNTNVFSGRAIGVAGIMPDSVKAFQTLMKDDLKDMLFKKLLDEAPLAGQLYALCGVYFTDEEYYKKVVQTYAGNTTHVNIQDGCSGDAPTVAKLLDGSSEPSLVSYCHSFTK